MKFLLIGPQERPTAKAANIFWQVGSSATLGTISIFKGAILAAISISVNTGAVGKPKSAI